MPCRVIQSGLFSLLVTGFFLPVGSTISAEPQTAVPTPKFSPSSLEFFEKKIRPLLSSRCYKCHGPEVEEPKGGMRFGSYQDLLTGGDTGPAIDLKDPVKGLLLDSINYGDLYQMPPKTKLPAAEIALLTKWIKMGAPWSQTTEKKNTTAKERIDIIKKRRRTHWAWQKLQSPATPQVKNSSWPRSEIDRFILARMEARGLAPAIDADRRVLIRRVYFDLIGLPPSPVEVDAWLNDQSPKAFEKVVDHLLDSPHFGERWARHWLDLVRYADSRGHEFDYVTPNAYQYRDYVIRALNADVPYDQFVTEHIAGDLIPQPRLNPQEGFDESILGTGFWFLGEWVHSPVDIRKDETDRFDNMIDVFGKTFLGLALGCVRCHDHKFDALTQKDYYGLFGYLQSSSYRLARFDSLQHNKKIAHQLHELEQQAQPKIHSAAEKTWSPVLQQLADYLLSAREIILSEKEQRLKATQTVLRQGKLNKNLLDAWIKHLDQARSDPSDPFHIWGKISHDPNADTPEAWQLLITSSLGEFTPSQKQVSSDKNTSQVIIDYSNLSKSDWRQDGVSFSAGPVQVGDLQFSSDPEKPISKVFTQAAAYRDPMWSVLKLAKGVQNHAARLGGSVRSGQTIRTPTFTIETGQVFYLVRGGGSAYAAVDSHRLNNGPLHGRLLQKWQDKKGSLQWIGQDLRAYVGHRAHLELTASSPGGFEVLRVVQATTPPKIPQENVNALLQQQLSTTDFRSIDSVAEAYQRLLHETARLFTSGKISQSASASDYAKLADWLVQHPHLVSDNNQSGSGSFQETTCQLVKQRQKLAQQINRESRLAMAMWDGSGEDEYLLIRGSHKTPGKLVPRQFIGSISGPSQPARTTSSGRLQLAAQLTDPQNPLISRVMVNRLWHHLFGRGIVASVDNFGDLGRRPTHPLLLDYLAGRLIQKQWSLKKTIKAIVMTRTYQMSGVPSDLARRLDPQNNLLSHMRVRRLSGEAIRDQILAVSGRLNPRMYGPGVSTHLTPFMQGRGRKDSGPIDGDGRRSIYGRINRNFLSPMMLAFDMPIPSGSMGRRNLSNVPAQALIMMNDPFVVEQANIWAKRILADSTVTPEKRIEEMYRLAFARLPSKQEMLAAMEFLHEQVQELGIPTDRINDHHQVWSDLAHVLMNTKEFIFIY